MKRTFKKLFCVLVFLLLLINNCAYAKNDREIVFADAGWDSIRFHNAVVGFIAKNLYGYSYREVPGSTVVTFEGLKSGEIDVHTEMWTNNIVSYYRDLENGDFKELSTNFNDNRQGIYVPRYVIEGDKKRNIEASAPDLKSVSDLKKYPEVFKDDENPEKGRIYGSIPGWEADRALYSKYLYYGLDENFEYFRPGSDTALNSAITAAYEKGVPIAAYYWEPTWLLGKYDMVLLEDAPYSEELYEKGGCEFPPVDVTVGCSNDFYNNDNEEIINLLSNYETSSELTSEALAYMQDNKTNYEDTAVWFLNSHEELIDDWLNEEDADKLKEILKNENSDTNKNFIFEFPFRIPLDVTDIDSGVRNFSVKYQGFFDSIRNGLTNFVILIENILKHIPWILYLASVFILSYKGLKSIKSGILYTLLVSFVGLMGLWNFMNETLAIVIASVLISLVLGFPIGVLLSTSDRADKIFRPILDTMQTMPVFVYLIPAMLFFGLGKAPAVIATVVYAIVPIVRLTNHGIRQIDKEIVEASIAFGSTKMQSLIKVQIPQAMPTIMTGVNQTIMMAMSMVVTTSMIGATGLGMEVLISVNRVEVGRGLISGIAVVIVAIILDRITQGMIKKSEEKKYDR